MENTIVELEIARQVCVRKIEGLARTSPVLTQRAQREQHGSESKKQSDKNDSEIKEWEERMKIINDKLYDLVETMTINIKNPLSNQ